MTLQQVALTDPTSRFKHLHSSANDNGYHPYVCHSAVVHWALVALGKTDVQAEELIATLIRKVIAEKRVQRKDDPWGCYGSLFCSGAGFTELKQNFQLADTPVGHCDVGDVVIIGMASNPAHSMVVVWTGNGRVLIRGFNNFGTFAQPAITGNLFIPVKDRYDDISRDLSTRFTGFGTSPMYRTSSMNFLRLVRATFHHECGVVF